MTQILRTIPADHYDALLGANSPSAGNVFATMADIAAVPSVNIYNSNGSLTANRTVSGAFDLDFANSGNFFRTGNITFTQGANRRLDLQQSTGLAGYNLTIEAGQGPVAGVGAGGSLILRPGNHGGGIGGGVGDIQLLGYNGALSARGSDFKFVTGSAVNNRGGNYDVITGNGSAVHVGGNFTITTGTGVKRGDIRFKNGTEGTVGHVWTQNIADGSGAWQALPAAPVTLYSGDGSTAGNRIVTLGGELIFNHGATGINGYVRMVSGGYFLNQTSIATNYFEYDNNNGTFLVQSDTHTRTGFKAQRSGVFGEMMTGGGKTYFNTDGYFEWYTNNTAIFAGQLSSTGNWGFGIAAPLGAKVRIQSDNGQGFGTIIGSYNLSPSESILQVRDASETVRVDVRANGITYVNNREFVGYGLGSIATGAAFAVKGSDSSFLSTNVDYFDGSNNLLYRMMNNGNIIKPAGGTIAFGATANINGSLLEVSGDIEVIGNTDGLVLEDRTLGTRHRLYLDNGSLFLETA